MDTQMVIVRDFEGEPLVRRVCGATAKKVFVCADQKDPRSPIGFPREDVFEYDTKVLQGLRGNYKINPSIWESAKQWREING